MTVDPTTTKYLIEGAIQVDGVVEKPDVVGAIFGQTEGLMGEELDLRDLQKSGRIGRIEVEIQSKRGKAEGFVRIPSSLDQVETAILAAALETIDRIGPCKAGISVQKVEDVRVSKRQKIVERAKGLLSGLATGAKASGMDIVDEVKQSIQVAEIITWGQDRLPAGPNVADASTTSIIVVEGRSDVLNLLRSGIKNAVAVEGTNVPKTLQDLTRQRTATAFVDGDRGGDLILKELLQVAEIDFVARAPRGSEVEELTQKQITKALRNKVPSEQHVEMYGLNGDAKSQEGEPRRESRRRESPRTAARAPARAAPRPEPAKAITPEVEKYRDLLLSISGTSKATIVDKAGGVAAEVPVRELAETLRKGNGGQAVIFDGIITQRILDLAADLGLTTVVGTKLGTVTKQPATVQVWTKKDFS
jgi:DNA primase